MLWDSHCITFLPVSMVFPSILYAYIHAVLRGRSFRLSPDPFLVSQEGVHFSSLICRIIPAILEYLIDVRQMIDGPPLK